MGMRSYKKFSFVEAHPAALNLIEPISFAHTTNSKQLI
jgi:uncharacterized protein with PIN domain